MKKLFKINLLLTAIVAVGLFTSAIYYAPDPNNCKMYYIGVDLGEDGEMGIYWEHRTCPLDLCFIAETLCCDLPSKCPYHKDEFENDHED